MKSNKFKSEKGYSMIEIGIGLLIIAVFTIFSITIFNGCYNNHTVIKQRNIAISHAVREMERILQEKDLKVLGFEGMIEDESILDAAMSASAAERAEGYYAVPEDTTENIENNMIRVTSYRRVPTLNSNEAMDNTVLKVNIKVGYKTRANADESARRYVELESLKVTR